MKLRVYQLQVSKRWMKNYTYIIEERDCQEAILVDPGLDRLKIENVLKKRGLTVTGILVTHTHMDHVDLVKTMAIKYGIPVWISRVEQEFYGYSCPNLIAIDCFEEFRYRNFEIKPYLTPGHTKGSVCYLMGENLFTGDTLFAEGCGLCFGKGANPYDMFDSLQLLKQTLSSQIRIYSGHSYGTPLGQRFETVLTNAYLQIEDKEAFVKFRMRKSQIESLRFQFPGEEELSPCL